MRIDLLTMSRRVPRGYHRMARRCAVAIGFAITIGALHAQAQTWPSRQVRVVLPFAAGGSTDAIARTLGQKLSEATGQPVVIDNRPGAAGAIATEHVAKSAPDGYTLLMATTSTHSVLPALNPRLPFDASRDFALVALVARAPNILIAAPAMPAGNVRELIAAARARPGGFNYASSGTGTITHLIGELFNASAGIQALHTPYKTGVQALPDLVSGQISWLFDSIVWTLPQIRAGKVKGLAITSRERSPLAPELPTVAESGLPGFEGVTWFGLATPSAVPKDVVMRINTEVNRLLQAADTRDKLAAQGAEAAGGTVEEFARLVQADAAKWGKVIRDAGVKVE